jgi:hypothetical protein
MIDSAEGEAEVLRNLEAIVYHFEGRVKEGIILQKRKA